MASQFVPYRIQFSDHACPEVTKILRKSDNIELSHSSTQLTKAVDFVTRDWKKLY